MSIDGTPVLELKKVNFIDGTPVLVVIQLSSPRFGIFLHQSTCFGT